MFKLVRGMPYSTADIHTYVLDIIALEETGIEEDAANAKIMRAVLRHMLKKNERNSK